MNYSNIQSESNYIYFYIIVLILLCVSYLNFSIIQMNNFRWFERARTDCIILSFKVLFCHQLLLTLFVYCRWSDQVSIQGNTIEILIQVLIHFILTLP